MKNSELQKLVFQYKEIIRLEKKKCRTNSKLAEKLKEIERRYFHETGRALTLDLMDKNDSN